MTTFNSVRGARTVRSAAQASPVGTPVSVASPPAAQPTRTTTCCCPACIGLQTALRPRYFSGQLLSDADLTSEQQYMLAKNRLHNRYLHGWGVVCGLQVVCNNCTGMLTIMPGYAIDPCGNDIVVCQSQTFDLLGCIKACQPANTNCAPPLQMPAGCADQEQEWCLTIDYTETQVQPTTALQWTPVSSGCGCGCGGGCGCSGNGNGNGAKKAGMKKSGSGCGCGGSSSGTSSSMTTTSSSSTSTTTSSTSGATSCEPTRIQEGFTFGCVRPPKPACDSLPTLLGDTLLAQIIQCIESVGTFLNQRVAKGSSAQMAYAAFGVDAPTQQPVTPAQAAANMYQGLYALFAQNPRNVECRFTDTLTGIQLPRANDDYETIVRPALESEASLLLQYVVDCVCADLNPPCPTDPCDDRIILACVTIANNQIVKICNFACRKFAGAFPSMYWWLSAIPIIPLIRWLITELCCTDWTDVRGVVNQLDADGAIRKALAANDFALPKAQLDRFTALRSQLNTATLTNAFHAAPVNLAASVGQPLSTAREPLQQAGVSVVEVPVASATAIPLSERVLGPSLVSGGSTVVAYTANGVIVGFGRSSAVPQASSDVASLRAEIASLKSDVDALKQAAAARTKSAKP